MPIITVIFVLWLGYSLWRGYQKGFWLTTVDLLAFVCAYIACVIWGANVNDMLGFNGLAMLLGYGLVYLLGVLCIGVLPGWLLRRVIKREHRMARSGAALGALTGVVSGLAGVWVYQLLLAAMQLGGGVSAPLLADSAAADRLLQNAAGNLMGSVSRAATASVETDPLTKAIAVQLAEKPAETLADVRALGRSAELEALLQSSRAQAAVEAADSDALAETKEFKAFVGHPAFAATRAQMLTDLPETAPGGTMADGEQADSKLAASVAQLWRKADHLRHDPEVLDLMTDPEIRQMLDEKKLTELLMHPKGRLLVARVMQAPAATEPTDRSEAAADQEVLKKAPLQEAPSYRWVDENGMTHFSDNPPESN
ncbi:CvpA family protein [Teredinibacter turnerae]|uniref:CvpA family protein n=1 Tax=Teredinibacter turnerae TaxID=2426 RepID=UPI0030CDEA0C